MHLRLIRLIFFALIFECGQAVCQDTIRWDKKGNGFWHVTDNWDLKRLPNSMDIVIIDHDSVVIANGIQASARKLIVGAKDSTGVGLAIFNTGALTTPGGTVSLTVIEASVFNQGKMQLGAGAPSVLLDTGSVLINGDSMIIQSLPVMHGITNLGHLHNLSTGTIVIQNPVDGITNFNSIVNDGTIHCNNAVINAIHTRFGSTMLQSGILAIDTCQGTAILCNGIMNNHGSIRITESEYGIEIKRIVGWPCQLINTDTIKLDVVTNGIVIEQQESELQNFGHISVVGFGDAAIINEGQLQNENTGSMLFMNNNDVGVGYQGLASGALENFGSITSINLDNGLDLSDNSLANNYGTIMTQGCVIGLVNRYVLANLGGMVSCTDNNLGYVGEPGSNLINDQTGALTFSQCGTSILVLNGGKLENRVTAHVNSIDAQITPLNIHLGVQLINEGTMDLE